MTIAGGTPGNHLFIANGSVCAQSSRWVNALFSMLDCLLTALHSFMNQYQAVMWRLRECPLNDEQLSQAIGLSSGVIRNRRTKPQSWKQTDIDRLARFFDISTTSSQQLVNTLVQVSHQLAELPLNERRSLERILQLKTNQINEYNLSGWTVQHLMRMLQYINRA